MNTPDPESERSESSDSILVEFNAEAIEIYPSLRPLRGETILHLPSQLRDSFAARSIAIPRPEEEADLADCLMEQAALFKSLRRFTDAAPRASEAAALYGRIGNFRRVADCFRLAAEIHREIGDLETALEFRRREEELRRRLAA